MIFLLKNCGITNNINFSIGSVKYFGNHFPLNSIFTLWNRTLFKNSKFSRINSMEIYYSFRNYNEYSIGRSFIILIIWNLLLLIILWNYWVYSEFMLYMLMELQYYFLDGYFKKMMQFAPVKFELNFWLQWKAIFSYKFRSNIFHCIFRWHNNMLRSSVYCTIFYRI